MGHVLLVAFRVGDAYNNDIRHNHYTESIRECQQVIDLEIAKANCWA